MVIQTRLNAKLFISCLIWFFSVSICSGQVSGYYKPRSPFPETTIGFGSGISSYYGDLQSAGVIPHPSFLLEYSRAVGTNLVSKTTISYYRIGASDAKGSEKDLIPRNLSFQANNVEISTSVEMRLFDAYKEKQFMINPYVFAGVGISSNNPFTEFQGDKVSLRSLQTEGVSYSSLATVFPMGIGLRIKPMSATVFLLEAGYRFTNTDYLDDVSTVYLDNDVPISDLAKKLSDRGPEVGFEPALPGDKRGEPGNKDGYLIMSMKIEIHLRAIFQQVVKKPKFR